MYECATLTPHDLLHRRPDPDARVHDPLVAEEGREGRIFCRQCYGARHLKGGGGGRAATRERRDEEVLNCVWERAIPWEVGILSLLSRACTLCTISLLKLRNAPLPSLTLCTISLPNEAAPTTPPPPLPSPPLPPPHLVHHLLVEAPIILQVGRIVAEEAPIILHALLAVPALALPAPRPVALPSLLAQPTGLIGRCVFHKDNEEVGQELWGGGGRDVSVGVWR